MFLGCSLIPRINTQGPAYASTVLGAGNNGRAQNQQEPPLPDLIPEYKESTKSESWGKYNGEKEGVAGRGKVGSRFSILNGESGTPRSEGGRWVPERGQSSPGGWRVLEEYPPHGEAMWESWKGSPRIGIHCPELGSRLGLLLRCL